MKKSRNSDKLFPLYKHPTDALPAPNGADFGVWGHCPQQAFFASVLTLALLAGLFSKRPLVPDVLFNTSYSCILQSRYVKYFLHIFDCCIVLLSEGVRKWRTVMNAQDSRRAWNRSLRCTMTRFINSAIGKRIAPLMRRTSRRIRLYDSWMRRRHIPTLKVQRRCSIRLRIISV